MKKPIVLILIGIVVVFLVVGIVFVVLWVGKFFNEMEQITEQQMLHKRALRQAAREPLTEGQENLLSQLLEAAGEESVPQSPSGLEVVLSREPYLAHLKMQEGQGYEDFPAYIAAMPTPTLKSVARSRLGAVLGTEKAESELQIWADYYFKVREWGTTVPDLRDNIRELNEFQQTHLIKPLMENNPKTFGLRTKIVQIGMASMFIIEDSEVFQHAWRERLEKHGVQEGLLRCAVAAPGEFSLMRSFFADMEAFQEWILTRPDSEKQAEELLEELLR